MRATAISMVAVLAFALGLCFFSMYVQSGALETMDDLRAEAVELVEAKEYGQARVKLVELATTFRQKSKVLELLASHDDLHDAYLHIVDAQISLACEDWDDILQALALLGETLEHLRAHERFSMVNLY